MSEMFAFKYSAGAAARTMPSYEDGSTPTLTADYHARAVALQTGHTSGNGNGVNTEDVSYMLSQAQDQAICIQGSMIGRSEKNGPRGDGLNDDLSFTLNCTDRHAVAFAQNTRNEVEHIGESQKELSPTLRASRSGTNGTPVVCMPNEHASSEAAEGVLVQTMHQNADGDVHVADDMTGTITAQSSVSRQQIVCISSEHTNAEVTYGHSPTLTTAHEQPIVCMAGDTAKAAIDDDMCGTLKVGGRRRLLQHGEEVSFTLATSQDQTLFDGTGTGYVVRRLTPVETERLQGFPDGWTDLTGCDADAVAEKVAASLHYDEKKSAALLRKVRKWSQECPDGPRYKACGNSMAVPVMRWIGSRIQMVDEMEVRG